MTTTVGENVMSRTLVYWVATALTALLFAIPGAALLANVPHFAADMARLGYPPYFSVLLGAFKIAGALAIVVPGIPRLKEWAYAGMILDVASAIASRAMVGDGGLALIVPSAIGLLALVSWGLRPQDRRLGNADRPVRA